MASGGCERRADAHSSPWPFHPDTRAQREHPRMSTPAMLKKTRSLVSSSASPVWTYAGAPVGHGCRGEMAKGKNARQPDARNRRSPSKRAVRWEVAQFAINGVKFQDSRSGP